MKKLVGRLESQQFLSRLIYCIVSRREEFEVSDVCITTHWVLNRRGQTMAKLAVLQLIILPWLRFICELLLKTNCLFNGAERWNQFQYASLKCPSYVKVLPEGARDTYISFCLCQFHFQFAIPTVQSSKIMWRKKLQLNANHLSLVQVLSRQRQNFSREVTAIHPSEIS